MLWTDFLQGNTDIVGKKVWITDVRLSDNSDGFVRHVKPTEVVIFSNTDLPKGKRVYYSEYHFRKLGKNGKPLAQIIAPFDNTGYRSYSGVCLHVFETEKEAVAKYNEQLDVVIEKLERRKQAVVDQIDNIIGLKV